MLSTTIFFGEYRGPLKTPNFTIEVEITPEQFRSLIDEYSIRYCSRSRCRPSSSKNHLLLSLDISADAEEQPISWDGCKTQSARRFVAILDGELAALKTASRNFSRRNCMRLIRRLLFLLSSFAVAAQAADRQAQGAGPRV